MSLIEVIRDELRQSAVTERKHCRMNEIDRRRLALGDKILDNIQGWNLNKVIAKASELKKKPLTIDDYRQLQSSLIQDEENINGFLSVDNIIGALVRDLSCSNPAIALAAANCCCNLALGNSKACTALCKFAGPYLVAQIESLNNPLLEVCIWTIGNLCNGSKSASEALHAQGCFKRLLSLLKECEATILPSVIYAIKHYLYSTGSKCISEKEMIQVAENLTSRLNFESSADNLWLLAILSSKIACSSVLISIVPTIFNYLYANLDKDLKITTCLIPIVRFLANVVPEPSGSVADFLTNNPEIFINIFNKLLIHPQIHINNELLWLIGNIYNHANPRISGRIRELLPQLSNLRQAKQAIQSR